ncbi:hypothetical protein ACT3S7_06160 [Corynebacterium sp. AOP34-AQ2-28]|uniref:hypothetical protein n=1 Tax=Corynebacterium sp. AOP34-AQ2-28 TaxID=3457689 RepID=UPI0040340143
MTPETARALEPGTTPGPWEAYDPGDGTARLYAGEGDDSRLLLHNVDSDPHTACVYFTREDGELMAAAPDMRATIAALRWEYAARWPDGSFVNLEDPAASSEETFWTWNRKEVQDAAAELGCSLVRRPAGPVEVVEE